MLFFLKVVGIALLHDYYVSVSTIHVRNRKADLEIKVFKDDLEKVLEISLDDVDEHSSGKIFDYFRINFKIKSNENDIEITFKGVEDLGESVVVKAEFLFDQNQNYTVINTIFISKFANQINLVHFKKNSMTKTVIFNRNNKTYTF